MKILSLSEVKLIMTPLSWIGFAVQQVVFQQFEEAISDTVTNLDK